MPRIIGLYLPQYHPIPENDEWWGKGFTEWTNVRKALPIFKGQEQPRVPLDGNYYDLGDVSTLRWQAKLASEYNVYGMCFYHYWFAGGKKLLEKPAEMLLANVDINMRFCFSWANEPWARTWDGKAHQVLMPQEYGDESDWRQHFDYLLPFFRDERYIKENGAPMFLVYKLQSIECAPQMMSMWNQWARQEGFNGIHFVETLRDGTIDSRNLPVKARVEFEPARSNFQQPWLVLNYKRVRRRVIALANKVLGTSIPLNKPFAFADVANRSLTLKSPKGTYGGAFVGWDNTARRGVAATVVLPPTKQEFRDYLAAKIHQTEVEYQSEYVFINAWNEWCEGTYLEPDTIHGYDYLEVIKELTEK